MTAVTTAPPRGETGAWRAVLPQLAPFIGIFAVAMILPFVSNDYWALIGTRAAIYWVLVSGLNLVVGFAGHLAIGYVALLTLGAYTTSVLVAGNVLPPVPVFAALPIAGAVGAVFGVIVGLPALRLRTFYFAMSTLGFATIVTQIALAWQSVTGGGIGISGPEFPAPFNTAWGYYYLCIAFAAVGTWISANVAHSRFGRALIAVRDAEVAAEATGISKPRMLIAIFLFAGALAAIAGGLFASLQTYITPDAFTFDLSVLFFIAILIGGRGSILGPMLGTIILTILPEIAAPLAAWSTFLYAVLLLVIVLVMPGGIAALLDFRNRRPLASNRAIVPRPAALAGIVRKSAVNRTLRLRGIALSFGNVRAIDGLDLDVEARPDSRPDRSQWQRQDHDPERDLRLLRRQGRNDAIGRRPAAAGHADVAGFQRHRPHLPDAARDRRGLGAAERHDRRHHRGRGDLRRSAAGAAAERARRADARGQGPRAARRRRP